MERLTKRELSILGDACYCKCHSNDCDYECDECNILSEGANKLKSYEDAEEQVLNAAGVDLQSMVGEFMHYYTLQKEGRLVELPCKVGDTVYQVIADIYEYTVTAIGIYENRMIICVDNQKTGLGYSFDAKRIGKRYFLTRKEAEAALERRNKQHD